MRVFLDTEFTELVHPQLLSLALVADGGAELYLEIDLQSRVGAELKRRAGSFTTQQVLPLFRRFPKSIVRQHALGERAAAWLQELAAKTGERVEITYDYAVDAALLEGALRGSSLWHKLSGELDWSIVGYLHQHPEAEEAKAASLAKSQADDQLLAHHALADARALRAAFHAAHGPRSPRTTVS